MFRYPALKLIASVVELIGGLTFLFSVVVIVVGIFVDNATMTPVAADFGLSIQLARTVCVLGGLLMMIGSLFEIAQGELIEVFIDIEANTRDCRSMLSELQILSASDRGTEGGRIVPPTSGSSGSETGEPVGSTEPSKSSQVSDPIERAAHEMILKYGNAAEQKVAHYCDKMRRTGDTAAADTGEKILEVIRKFRSLGFESESDWEWITKAMQKLFKQ
ncbi:MAG: hypothetical protein ACREEL_08325 [Stellaceae bacterium]